MSEFLPREVRDGMQGDPLARHMRLRIGTYWVKILRAAGDRIVLSADDVPHLRGAVEMYDGDRYVGRCLIAAESETEGEITFVIKRRNMGGEGPPRDFAPEPIMTPRAMTDEMLAI